jgi:uncharacterized membrane protein
MTPDVPERVALPAGARIRDRWRWARQRVERKLTWSRIYRATSYLKSALWTVPLFAIVLDLLMVPLLRRLDLWLGWEFSGLGVTGAEAMLQTVITLTLSFIVFTFGSLLVAIQVAGGQLTPRIIATALLRDNVVRYSVGLFVFTLVFAVMVLNRTETTVYQLAAFCVAALGIACMAAFLFLIDYAARLLRPVSIVSRIGDEGVAVVRSVYPLPAHGPVEEARGQRERLGAPARTVLHVRPSEIVLAVDLRALVALAQRAGGVIEFVPQVGDFVAADEPLFHLYGGAGAIRDGELRAAVAFGSERTLEQDPMFAFRILVDIALKALSPAINDPTTAVLALDQVHRLLRVLGKRQLHGEIIWDASRQARVFFRTPNWEDYVHVACNEIRSCGAHNLQIARRMRAMLQDLVRALPGHCDPALQQQLALLDRAIEKAYDMPEDLALARIPDVQGLGGSTFR